MKLFRFLPVFATLLIVVLAAAVAQASSTVVTFAYPPTGFDSSGVGADQVILADFNRDGIPDMVVCNTDSYSIFLGNGDGTFTFNNNYPSAGTGVNLCAVADMNRDGYLDIVATTNFNANDTGGGVDVLLGNGDGTFQGPVSYGGGGGGLLGFETFAIAVGDMNGDGIPDLVLTSNCQLQTCLNGYVTVLLQNPNGSFQYPIIVAPADGGPIALADMNGDGHLDIVFNGGVMLNDGLNDWIFNTLSGGELVGGAVSIAVGDVNGDGKPDVVEVTDLNQVDVLLGNGDGTLQPPLKYKTGGFWPLDVTIANNLDGAGLPDLVVSNECEFTQKGSGKGRCSDAGYVSLLTNKGGVGPAFLGFNAARVFPSGAYAASSTAVADINGDGKPDLVIANLCTYLSSSAVPCTSDGWVQVMLNNTSIATATTLAAAPPSPVYVNQPVTLTATTTSLGSPSVAIANNTLVTFYQGTTPIGTGTTNNGVANLPTLFASTGVKYLKATFAGDTWNAQSSGTLNLSVALWPTTTSVTTNPSTWTKSVPVLITATVSSSAPGGATGSVTFKKGSATLGSAPLSGGVASLSYAFPSTGTFTITANYSGDTQSAKSSGTITQTVAP